MLKQKTKLALFDIDGTIFRSSLFLELFYALIGNGTFPAKARHEVEPSYAAWLNRKGHYNDYLAKALSLHYKYLPGKPKATIDRVAKRMIDRQKDRVYRYTRDLITDLKKKGYYIIAASNSQDYVVSQFAHEAGFDGSISRGLEVKNGKYTGRVMSGDRIIQVREHVDKVQVLKDFLAQKGITPDFKNSYAVGDSEGDLAILGLVGNPIAFNPSSGLAKIAQRKGWQIVVERKDVIYRIKDCAFIQKSPEPQKSKWK